MPLIDVEPRIFTNYLLECEGDNYEAHVAEVTLTPSATVVTRRGASPGAKWVGVTQATWVLGLDVTQDWTTADSLSYFLLENEGQTKEFKFSPLEDIGPTFTVTASITPGTIGGALDTVGASPVSLPVHGKPTWAPPTP